MVQKMCHELFSPQKPATVFKKVVSRLILNLRSKQSSKTSQNEKNLYVVKAEVLSRDGEMEVFASNDSQIVWSFTVKAMRSKTRLIERRVDLVTFTANIYDSFGELKTRVTVYRLRSDFIGECVITLCMVIIFGLITYPEILKRLLVKKDE